MSATQVDCHDRYGRLDPRDFARRACSLCYTYLFPSDRPAYIALVPDFIYLMSLSEIHTAENSTGRDRAGLGAFHDSAAESTVYRNNPVGDWISAPK